MRIEPLSYNTLDRAINLVNNIFPYQKNQMHENCSITLTGSLNKNSLLYRFICNFMEITDLNYWVAVDDIDDRVIGITGLYSYLNDKEEAYWLGYTCVEPDFRGQGIGGKLVDLAIAKATDAGKKFLRLYTSNSPQQAVAQILYQKKGFRIIAEKNIPQTNFKTIYCELKL